MSTVDPSKVQETPRSGGTVVAAIALLLHLGLWILAGYGGGMMLDSLRLMAINQVGDGWSSPYDDVPWLFLVGVIGGSLVGFLVAGSSARRAGTSVLISLGNGVLGVAIGLALFLPAWTPPEVVGFRRGFQDGDPNTPWDAGSWIAFAMPSWLPAVLLFVAVLLGLGLVRRLRRERREAQVTEELRSTGRRVPGVVTSSRHTGLEILDQPVIEFVVRFQDAQGTTRWVTKKSTFDPVALPRVGDATEVVFDPLDPGNLARIRVGIGADAI